MKKVTEIEETFPGAPHIYEGRLDSGESFYARFRFGNATLEVPSGNHIGIVYTNKGWENKFPDGILSELFTQCHIDLPAELLAA